MTATPHNGHEESFQLFMALLDSDRFEGKFRDGVHQQDPSDLMRRMIKEELVRFDGTPLFPERRSYTAEYTLSDMEAHLYQEVTHYVRTEMNRADRIAGKDGSRRVNVGFALMTLQRRLASSSLAIYKSLTRRRERLESRLREEQILLQGRKAGEGLVGPSADAAPLNLGSEDDWDDLYDDTPQEELEDLEEELVDNATAAQSIEELQAEIVILTELEGLAKQVVQRGQDAKWTQLQQLLDHPLMKGPNGERRKLVIFSEYKDTLHYLAERIRTYIGRHEPVVEIHGGVGREERRKIVHAFMNDPEVQILVANDAAGEGVNLQRAHLMVNYDLPWNPNRLEQRFGRIHRIGQKEVCHLWNLIASNTREGDVYVRLLHKLEAEAEALQGKVFDVLGQLFEQRPLRHLLKEAIVYGEDPAVKARLYQEVEGAFDPAHLQDIMDRRALAQDTMDTSHLAAIRDEIERAEAARLQPFYIEAFFLKAFERLGGRIHKREKGRYEITHVPQSVRDRDRIVGSGAPVLKRYERICFDKEHLEPSPRAELVCPGHPLLDATIDLTLERSEGVMKQGAILVDKGDPGDKPRLLFYIEHAIQDGRRVADGSHRVISKRLQYLETSEAGGFRAAGPAPYVDYDWLPPEDLALVEQHLEEPWLQKDWDHEVISWASTTLVPEHLREVKAQRLPAIEKAKNEIRGRLLREINHWDSRAQGLRDRELAGQKTRLSAAQAAERSRVLEERLHSREADLELERSINAQPPRLVGGVLVIPQGLLTRLRGEESTTPSDSVDAEARKRIELLAMDAVIKAELCLGRVPEDVSARRGIGYDILSKPSNGEGETLFIEVKGRVAGSMDVTLTTNEIRCSNNKPAQFVLAVVEVEGDAPGEPTYVRGFDFGRPGFDQTSAKYQLSSLLQHGAPPQ